MSGSVIRPTARDSESIAVRVSGRGRKEANQTRAITHATNQTRPSAAPAARSRVLSPGNLIILVSACNAAHTAIPTPPNTASPTRASAPP